MGAAGKMPSSQCWALAALAFLVVLLAGAAPAEATFAGQNGRLVVDRLDYARADAEGRPRNIYLDTINPDGTGRLTLADRRSGQGIWSPDGKRIAFTSGNATTCCYWENTIEVANADGSEARTIYDAGLRVALLGWSADGRQILFNAWQKYWFSRLYAINPDGTGLTQLSDGITQDTPWDQQFPMTEEEVGEGAWSPTGDSAAFIRRQYEENGSSDLPGSEAGLWTVNRDGSRDTQLTSDGGGRRDLAWAPGPRIAFSASGNLFTMDPGESQPRQLTNFAGFGSVDSIAWSPDGSRLAFRRGDDLWTVRPDGSGLTRTVTHLGLLRPVWSPDGRRIAFSAFVDRSDQRYAVFVIELDGSGLRQVTNSADHDWVRDWQAIVGPRRSDYKNATKFCQAERAFLGRSAFAARYGKRGLGRCLRARSGKA